LARTYFIVASRNNVAYLLSYCVANESSMGFRKELAAGGLPELTAPLDGGRGGRGERKHDVIEFFRIDAYGIVRPS
jgi:hypothetical protein